MKLTGARILMECLREQKVDTIFGYPGGTILNVYDALYDCKEITHILTSHEQGAAHAADGYARSTGKVGVCFATSGPGATNLTTGIATAYMDSSSVVFISCNVPQNLIGRDAFQEVDITGITMPITKSTYLVRDVTKLADTVREAFALARSGRPGPVVIDITRDVTSAECDYEPLPLEQHAASGHLASLIRRAYTSSLKMPEADLDDVEKLVEMIAESKKPMLICGGGVVRSRAHEEFRQFVRRIDAPVAITVMGGGGVSGPGRDDHRHDRDARLRGLQHGLRQLRPADRRGLPVLRPGGTEAGDLRASGQDRPYRHRPGGDQQERPDGPPHRRRCPSRS